MRKIALLSLTLCMSMLVCTLRAANPETKKNNAAVNDKSRRVLVIGMDNNVVSNYFTKDMLAEDTDISEDSVCAIYNNVIMKGLAAAARKENSSFSFIEAADAQDGWTKLSQYVRIDGEDDKTVADLSTVNAEKLKKLLDDAGASYLLLLDAHYMKYQEKPFKTLFHYVNYSLYDGSKKKLAQGSNYFTSINPQNKAQMIKSSRKSTEKIVEMVENTLD